jgi:alkylation response protein AidB-like acyl-CoA dehydrogenase
VDFRLSEDQEALAAGVRAFCDAELPHECLAELAKQGGFDRALWSGLAELGVFGLRLPESQGGVGLGMADAVLVFAELGRRLAPGPLVWSQLAAERVPGAASGEVVVGGVDLEDPLAEPLLVEHLEQLDTLLLLKPGGVFRIDPRPLVATRVATPLDPLTPLHHVAALTDGEQIGGPELAVRLRLEGAALVAAQLFGIAEATQELATAYAKQREQFGRTIASFQAIKHILADMWVRQEMTRAAVYAAGATLDQPDVGDPARAVSSARLLAGETAMKNARACIQVHGGMGYTWELPCHYFLKRTWALDTLFGTAEAHAERVAAAVERGL